MKKHFSLIFISLIVISSLPVKLNAQTRRERKILYNSQYNYEIEPVGVGTEGTKVFKVWGVGKNVNEAIMNAKTDAVAACIFKGLPGGAGSAPTPPIIIEPNAENKYADYFETFFTVGGKYPSVYRCYNRWRPCRSGSAKTKERIQGCNLCSGNVRCPQTTTGS